LLVDRIIGHEVVAGLEIAERYRIGLMIGPRPIPDARAAGAAKEKVGGVTALAGVLPHPCFFFAIDADLLDGKTDLRGEGAAAARLALAAMADRHADRIAGAGDAKLAAAAGGMADALGHLAA